VNGELATQEAAAGGEEMGETHYQKQGIGLPK